MIEIYIDNKKLDLTEEININFTYSSVDTQKPSVVRNSFSKSISIPGTFNNDQIFGNIWRFDSFISAGYPDQFTEVYFDPHKRTPFMVLRNGSMIENGYAVLDSIKITSEREHSYNITLYGGLGEFFFNLMYDEDGNQKNLADLYWKWIPLTSTWNALDYEDDPMTPNEEDTSPVYRLNSSNVAYAYHRFDPNDTTSFTSKTFIGDDIMFVPMYYGYNNDFVSKKFLVNRQSASNLPASITANWDKSFPASFTNEETNYSTYYENTEDNYGVIELPRDIDPAEARNFRVINMPIAIKISKLMGRISDSINNGGYNVVWDNSIKDSYWWKYGFVLVDSPEYDLEEASEADFSFENMTLEEIPSLTTTGAWSYNPTVDANETISTTVSTINNTDPKFMFKPTITGTIKMHRNEDFSNIASLGSNISGNKYLKTSNALCWLVQFYDGTTLVKSNLCMASFSNTGDHFGSGYSINGSSTVPSSSKIWKTKVIDYVNNRFSLSLETTDLHMQDSIGLQETNSQPQGTYGKIVYFRSSTIVYDLSVPTTINSLTVKITNFDLSYLFYYDGSVYRDYVYGKTPDDINAVISLTNNISTFYTSKLNFVMNLGIKSTDSSISGSYYKAPGWISASGGGQGPNVSVWNLGETFTSSYLSYLYEGSELSSFIDIYKSTILNNTKTPYSYLIDFAKLLNLRFIYDKAQKKITILPNGKYYLDQTVDLTDKVDYSRGIKLVHLFNKNKFIKAMLETPETWPSTIYKKISKYDFGEYIKDTGIMFNKDSINLFDSLIYSNAIMYQQKSIYHNFNSFLPSPVAQTMVDWTLFSSSGDDIKSSTQSFPADNKKDTIDVTPKVGSFDKDNKTVKVGTTFVFFNGLVKNFDSVFVSSSTQTTTLTPDSINENHYIDTDGNIGNSSYQSIYIYNNIDLSKTYKVTASFSSGYISYVVNYYSGNTRIGTQYSQTSANLVDATLTIPSGTTIIRCNFRKTDTAAKLTVTEDADNYILSPRVMLTDNARIQTQLAGGPCYYWGYKTNGSSNGYGESYKNCAVSWYMPYFSRNLFNTYNSTTHNWTINSSLLASWDTTKPENNLYDEQGMEFITDSSITYDHIVVGDPSNFAQLTNYSNTLSTYIIPYFWESYINDLYDINAKEIEIYAIIDEEPNTALRKFYSFEGNLWIITKIENYQLNSFGDRFSKCTLHKVRNKNNYLYSTRISLEQQQQIIQDANQNQTEI